MQIVGMMPVVAGWDILCAVVFFFQRFCLEKLRNGFLGAPQTHQLVAAHVVRVGNRRSHAQIDG